MVHPWYASLVTGSIIGSWLIVTGTYIFMDKMTPVYSVLNVLWTLTIPDYFYSNNTFTFTLEGVSP